MRDGSKVTCLAISSSQWIQQINNDDDKLKTKQIKET